MSGVDIVIWEGHSHHSGYVAFLRPGNRHVGGNEGEGWGGGAGGGGGTGARLFSVCDIMVWYGMRVKD